MCNLDKYQKSLELDKILDRLSNFANTELGKKRCKNAVVFNKKETIKYELSLVDEAKKIFDDEGKTSIFPLDFICDTTSILENIKLSANDIYELTVTLRNARILRSFIHGYGGQLDKIAQELYTNKELEDEVFSIFDNSLNITDGASPELKKLRNSKGIRKEI